MGNQWIIDQLKTRPLFLFLFFRAAREQKKAQKAIKKAAVPTKQKPVHKQKATKVQQKAAPRVGGKR
jgi:hypothetical protein